ncbi:hypothetical protein FOBRF1_001567 [Fusarium oxysporum]
MDTQPIAATDRPSNEELLQCVEELDKADIPVTVDLKLLFETLTHCAEPDDSEVILVQITGEKPVDTFSTAATTLAEKERVEALKEHSEGQYRVRFDGRSFPETHHTWPEDFRLLVEDDREYFIVLQSGSAQPENDDKIYPTSFAHNDPKTRNNGLIGKEDNDIKFNFAEHKMMGEMLRLRWSPTETSSGMRELSLPNDVKLNYGEINGLGGDSFGGFTLVSNGDTFEQQCKLFGEAFATLGHNSGAKQKVQKLPQTRQKEVEAVSKAVDEGESTFKAYKDLLKPAKLGRIDLPGLSQDDVGDQAATAFADGPSYLRLAQINLDHFGQDAITAYNAGHYCAMRAAAEGNLELGYAMNAFADHYLGDCFASGHFQIPRRLLHGSNSGFEATWDALSGMLQSKLSDGKLLEGAMKVMVHDLLAMLMHNEDNALGITVKSKNGTKFTIWGDKQLFEPKNARYKEMMKLALQSSIDGVYEAFVAKSAKPPIDRLAYRAWDYAPLHVVEAESHSPLFVPHAFSSLDKLKLKGWFEWPLKIRHPFFDPYSKTYQPVGNTLNLIKLYNNISSSEQWKKY